MAAVFALVFTYLALDKGSTPPAVSAPRFTPAPVETTEPRPSIAALGDSYTGGSEEDSGEVARWPYLVARALDVPIDVIASGGSGYVVPGPNDTTFPELAADVPADSDLVIIYGSRNDVATAEEVYDAATATVFSLGEVAPDADIIIVGPTWITADPPQNILDSESALTRVAADQGLRYVSSLAWLTEDAELIGGDGVHPNDAGHAVLADRMDDVVEEWLAASTS
ncbi:SGNH/GDSL hydrolase family protein [Microbacterium gilvum]|uniref:SGNH/GDSL hydrolase family protein n=1 Tax=Microbacterium gilvum TaxID=1336204 RepID=UPI0031EE4871